MKLFSLALAVSAFAALAACGGEADDAPTESVEAAADNQSEALEQEAANLSAQADSASGNVAETLENQAAALEEQAEAVDETQQNTVTNEAQ